MRFTNNLTLESGVASFLPTSLGYNRRLKKQAEKMEEARKLWVRQQEKIREGKMQVKSLHLQTFYEYLDKDERKHAETICVTQGYENAKEFISHVGMAKYRSGRTRIYL